MGLSPHINVTHVRSAERILVVNPLRPEARRRDTVADDVDGQEQAALPHLSQIALEARDLTCRAGEEDTATRADCIANPNVDPPADAALDVLGSHDAIERGSILDQHMLDAATTVGPGGSADDTTVRNHTFGQEAKDAAAGGSLQQLTGLALGPADPKSFVALTPAKRGTHRFTRMAPHAGACIDNGM